MDEVHRRQQYNSRFLVSLGEGSCPYHSGVAYSKAYCPCRATHTCSRGPEMAYLVASRISELIISAILVPLASIFIVFLAPTLWAIRGGKRLAKAAFTPYNYPLDPMGKVVVITGASSGIGEAMAYEFSKRGARVVLAARRKERLREVRVQCRRWGALEALDVPTDVTQEESVKALVSRTVEAFGGIDILVNNAGTAHTGILSSFKSPEEFKGTMDVDFVGNLLPTLYSLPHLKRSDVGTITVVSSVATFTTFPKQSFYNAAKMAVSQFYATLRVEEPFIHITNALPGFVVSELTAKGEGSHIPWWWPMLGTREAAQAIVKATLQQRETVVVPSWYTTWLFYRIFAPQMVDWSQSVLILGKLPGPLANLWSAWQGQHSQAAPQIAE